MKRIILLIVLALEGLGGIFGGLSLVAAPDGHNMKMSVEVMHGVFSTFLIPGIFLTGLGILTSAAFIAVLRKSRIDWIMACVALVGYAIWFAVEIAILQELHWLHIIWGVPVLIGLWIALSLIPEAKLRRMNTHYVFAIVIIILLLVMAVLSSVFTGKKEGIKTEVYRVTTHISPSVSPDQSDEEVITQMRKAFSEKYHHPPSTYILTLIDKDTTHAVGTVRFTDEMGGAIWHGAVDNGNWVLVADGQGPMNCQLAEKYAFPPSMVPGCIDTTNGNKIIQR